MRTLVVICGLAAAVAAQAAPARLGEAEVRAFVARQEKAWNAGDLAGFFALFTPDATFTDQARARDGRVVPYGTSSVAQARAQSARSFAKSRIRESSTIRTIQVSPDGRSARVQAREESFITSGGRTRHLCAETEQVVLMTPAGLRSRGQTDTIAPCR